MLPLHSSGICACVYHVFYNAPAVSFLVALQAALTTFGNTTLAFATYRLAVSNGWNPTYLPEYAKVLAPYFPVTETKPTVPDTPQAETPPDVADSNLRGFEDQVHAHAHPHPHIPTRTRIRTRTDTGMGTYTRARARTRAR